MESHLRQPPASNPNPKTSIGERIRQAREAAGLTQEALGQASGTSRSLVSQWEAGTRNPGVRSLKALSGPLKVTIEWLVSGIESEVERDHNSADMFEADLLALPPTPMLREILRAAASFSDRDVDDLSDEELIRTFREIRKALQSSQVLKAPRSVGGES